jgi:surfactin synthase thioesterase subunit
MQYYPSDRNGVMPIKSGGGESSRSTRLLVCFPYAGAGASFFRSWVSALGRAFEVFPVQLPGREERFAEPLCTSVDDAIVGLLPQIAAKVRGKRDIVIFGHSLGAVLAYELAERLTGEFGLPVSRLVVSGAHAPHRPRGRRATGLTDEQFLAQVRSFAGYTHPALEDPEMRDLLLPLLRADVEMHESYLSRHVDNLKVPITCVRGRSDELVQAEDLAHWQEVTANPVELLEVDGGHMYLVDKPSALFDVFENIPPGK